MEDGWYVTAPIFKHVLLNKAVNYRDYMASVTDKYGAFVE